MNISDTHKQEEVIVRRGFKVIKFDCDILIAPLIRKLNKAGFKTSFCCSGHEEDAFYTMYISFDWSDDEEYLDNLCSLINGYFIPEFYYQMRSVGRFMHQVTLCNPSIEDLRLATKLCFNTDLEDVFHVGDDERARNTGKFRDKIETRIIFRPNIPLKKYSKEYIEENYKFVIDGISIMEKDVDDILRKGDQNGKISGAC